MERSIGGIGLLGSQRRAAGVGSGALAPARQGYGTSFSFSIPPQVEPRTSSWPASISRSPDGCKRPAALVSVTFSGSTKRDIQRLPQILITAVQLLLRARFSAVTNAARLNGLTRHSTAPCASTSRPHPLVGLCGDEDDRDA